MRKLIIAIAAILLFTQAKTQTITNWMVARDSLRVGSTWYKTLVSDSYISNDTLYIVKAGVKYFYVIPTGSSDCPISFDDIDGTPANNAALSAALLTKQDLIAPANNYIDTQFYYFNGYKSYKLLAPDVRIAMDATYDPVSKFMTYGSKSNQILNLKNIGNLDTINIFGGVYRYNVSTTGTKPGISTGGTVYMYTQSDLNYHDGTNRVSQFAIDNNGQMWARTYNAGWGSWISPAYSTDLASYLPLTGGTINGYVSMVHKSATPSTPSAGTSTYYVDNLGYFRFYTATGNYWRIDTTGMGTSNLTFKIANATVQGNTFNGANQLVQLNSSGYFQALDARNLINISPTTGLAVGAGTPLQQLRINGAGTAWELFTPTSGASTSGTSILKGNGSGGFSNATPGTDYLTDNSSNTLTNKTIGVTQLNGNANSIAVNNTSSTANYTEVSFYGVDNQTYTQTPTWDGTTPSGTIANTYSWDRLRNKVTLQLNLTYTTAGVTNTNVVCPLPSDMPAPKEPSQLTAVSSILCYGTGGLSTTNTNAVANNCKVYIRKNAAGTGYELVAAASASLNARVAHIDIFYFTN
ncbi:hypothetical protein [Limnovirga soli]|uniref:Uncharacterized protein n=1 Tax=Limnovirga soli TaxID=2656915 RepID=A0A8J8JSW3_9BACT|nr:hypothetical protein [Limnovirga soli]NNV54515.1 hypothetical protein [Limnovirga soli]